MNLPRKILTLALATFLSLASACANAPTPIPTRGLSESQIRTQAVGTALAGMTASALLPTDTATPTPPPSDTLAPSATPTQYMTPTLITPTLTLEIQPKPTLTFTPAQTDFQCEIVKQSPAGDTFEPDEDFDLSVTLKNTGDADWKEATTYFVYTHGKYIQQQGLPTFIKHTNTGGELHVVVDVRAPDIVGDYTTYYALIRGKLFFCPVAFNFTVK